MKRRSRLRQRVRDWLKKRREQKEEKPLPSFADGKDHQEQLVNIKGGYER